jgi:hypothetical protein
MTLIIHKGTNYGTLDGAYYPTPDLYSTLNACLKSGRATKLIDTEQTLMYKIDERNN